MGHNEGASALLPVDAFVRSISVNRQIRHSYFLGAGASISSGVPTASQCLWQWKRTLFATRHPQIDYQLTDPTLPSVRERIQKWLDGEGVHPPLDDQDEYSHYAEACYPIAADRSQYFRALVGGANPHAGYKLLALLADARLVRSIWSTNFDGLAARAIRGGTATAIEVGLDSATRIDRAQALDEVLCVSLHGDYRYDRLKNTSSELQEQDRTLRDALVRELHDSTLIVLGYSGRDDSVVSALESAYCTSGPGRLFWCSRSEVVPERVQDIVRNARNAGHEAFVVPGCDFDDVLWRLALQCLDGAAHVAARRLHSEHLASADKQPAAFKLETPQVHGFLKSNAFPIECPSEILELSADGYSGQGSWSRLRELSTKTGIVAVPYRGKILALGTVDAVKTAFGDSLRGAILRTPVGSDELHSDGVITELFTRALLGALSANHSLPTDGRNVLWSTTATRRLEGSTQYLVHDAALCHLRTYSKTQYLVIKPTIVVRTLTGESAPPHIEKEFKRAILTRQYNRDFNEAIERWRKVLIPDNDTIVEYPPKSASTFQFKLGRFPAFASLYDTPTSREVVLPPVVQTNTRYRGRLLPEPSLVFSERSGTQPIGDVHPVRGLLRQRPFDYALTVGGLHTEVAVSVICPRADSPSLAAFLPRLHQQAKPTSKSEYLLEYPGFSQAFGLPLSLPNRETPTWLDCPAPTEGTAISEGASQLARSISGALDQLQALGGQRVALIYIPERWQPWERYDLPSGRFDLHDFIKAYAVQRGIATQFLREGTLRKTHACEILWWLSLALYVKSMRTPWRLAEPNSDVAFMGLGFSVDRATPSGHHIVVGCSHIYSAEGLGLRFRLRQLEDPIVRQGNPFMRRDDARRIAEGARQLFFESNMRLPRRVSIHKRTPFSDDEVLGLREGMDGVAEVDLVSITVDPTLRWIASDISWGKPRPDAFPVRRGTVLLIDDLRALLWVHGTTSGLQPGRRYYQGKSRIPAPLLVTRYAGRSDLTTLAHELLGLTKMNWNTLDLYTTMPATLDSSNAIASIGKLLTRFGAQSFDYRLFM